MSKPIPYFRFECANWLAGKISRRSFEEKGLLVEIMVLAFSKGGWLPWGEIEQEDFADDNRIDIDHLQKLVSGLVRRGILIENENQLTTKFVLETKQKVEELREKRSKAGAKGGRPKASEKQLESKCFLEESKTETKKTNASNTSTNTSSSTNTDTNSREVAPTLNGLPVALGAREPLCAKFIHAYRKQGGGINLNPGRLRQAMARLSYEEIEEIIEAIPLAEVFDKEDKGKIPCGSRFITDGLWQIQKEPKKQQKQDPKVYD